jgi:hypothetical protein
MSILNILKLLEHVDYSSLRNIIKTWCINAFKINPMNHIDSVSWFKNILFMSLVLLHLNHWLIIILNDLTSNKVKYKNQSYKLT